MGDLSRNRAAILSGFLLLLFATSCADGSHKEGVSRDRRDPERVSTSDELSDAPRRIIIKDRFPAYSPGTDAQVNATAHLVDSLYRNHRTKALIEHADDVLALLKHKLSGEDIGVGRELGLAFMKLHGGLTQERGVEAAQYFVVKASKLWDTSRPPSDSVGIELLATTAKGCSILGQRAEATATYVKAFHRALDAHNWVQAGNHGRALAYSYLESGNRDSARIVFERVIALHSAPASVDTSWWAGSLLASVAAEPDSLLIRLERVRRLLHGVKNPQVISFYYGSRGRYLAGGERTKAAATCFKQAVLSLDTVSVKTIAEAEALAINLHNTAYAYRNLDELDRSKQYGTRAVALNEALMGSDDPLVARKARDRLAGTLEVMPLTDTCDARYGTGAGRQMSVLRLRTGRTPVDLVAVAKTYANIATEYFQWDSLGVDSVLKYAGLCLEGPCRGETVAAMQLMAFGLAVKGRYAESLDIVQRACGILSGDDHFMWDSLKQAAFPRNVRAIVQIGTLEEVLEILQRKDPGIRQQGLLQRLTAVQSDIIDSLFMVEGTDLSKLITSREQMTARLMRDAWPSRGNRTTASLSDSLFAWMDDDKAMAFRRDRFLMEQADRRELRSAINIAKERRESLAVQGLSENDPSILRQAVLIDSVEALLAQQPVNGSPPSHVDMDLAERLRDRIAANTAMVSYRLTKKDVFIAGLYKDTIMLGRFARDTVFDAALAKITAEGSGIDSLIGLDGASRQSLQRLLPPSFLRSGVKELVILPSRELCYLPFEALPTKDDGAPLMDKLTVRYALSGSVLLDQPTNDAPPNDQEVFAFAPDYGERSDPKHEGPVSRNVLMGNEQRASSGALLYNADEVSSIADEVVSTCYTGNSADESRFKASLDNAGVLHLAMHAFSSDEPTRSGLVFKATEGSDAQDRSSTGPDVEDGVFHAYELLTHRLKADLIILSACETGYGSLQSGEGVRSLARSFMQAGARSTVSSLWKVDDLATKQIMVKFYEKLAEGMGKADALAEAKRWYRTEYPDEPPSKWAAFILIGDNEPVHLQRRSPMRPWMWGGGLVLLLGGAFWAYRSRRHRTAA